MQPYLRNYDIFRERNLNAITENAKPQLFDIKEKKNKRDTKVFTSSFVLIFNANANIVPEVKT